MHKLSCTQRCLQCMIVHTKIVYSLPSCNGPKISAKTPLCQAVYNIQIRANPQCLMLAIATFNLLFFEEIPCKSVQYWVPMSKLQQKSAAGAVLYIYYSINHWVFPLSEHFSSNYCWNIYKSGNQQQLDIVTGIKF